MITYHQSPRDSGPIFDTYTVTHAVFNFLHRLFHPPILPLTIHNPALDHWGPYTSDIIWQMMSANDVGGVRAPMLFPQ
jgi:hypothetical protein